MTKTSAGNFFEDFRLGQTIRHATPRTMTGGDVSLYTALFGARFAVQSSAAFAKAIGYPDWPLDDLLVFHIVFGKTVPDVSLNAVANLGYAGMQFLAPVFAGDTLERDVGGDRAQGELQPQDRHRLCPHPRREAGRHRRARIRALGDGAKARRERARAGRSRAAAADRGRAEAAGRRLPADRRARPTTSRWPAARTASATTRSARRSTTSTASPSRRPSTRPRRGSIRTPRASISTSSRRRRAASASG